MGATMKLSTLVTLLVLARYSLEQFHQNSYYIDHEKLEITHYNHSAVVDPNFALFKYNETLRMKAINGSAYFTPGVKKNILINAALYRLVKNTYRPFPINVTIDLCKEWSKNTFGMQGAAKKSNFRGCPCPVGLYYVHDAVLEEDKFPPHIPTGKYRLAITVHIDDNTLLGRGNWYGSITPKSADAGW